MNVVEGWMKEETRWTKFEMWLFSNWKRLNEQSADSQGGLLQLRDL